LAHDHSGAAKTAKLALFGVSFSAILAEDHIRFGQLPAPFKRILLYKVSERKLESDAFAGSNGGVNGLDGFDRSEAVIC
jgi:hypothetical protein